MIFIISCIHRFVQILDLSTLAHWFPVTTWSWIGTLGIRSLSWDHRAWSRKSPWLGGWTTAEKWCRTFLFLEVGGNPKNPEEANTDMRRNTRNGTQTAPGDLSIGWRSVCRKIPVCARTDIWYQGCYWLGMTFTHYFRWSGWRRSRKKPKYHVWTCWTRVPCI